MDEKNISEEKLKKENESFKRQVNFYKEKLKIDYIYPIKKIELNYINSINMDSNNTNLSKLMSPYKYIKPANNSSNNTTINKPLHRKKISNNNITTNLLNDNKEIVNNRKRVSSMDIRKIEKANNDNNYTISANTGEKSIKYLFLFF